MKPVVISEVPISMAELKNELDMIKTRDGELNFRANKTEEYLNNFVTLDAKNFEELKKKLEDLNVPRLKPEYVIKIIDLLPGTVEDLKVILQGYAVSVNQDNMKKIVAVVKDYIAPA